MGIISSLGRELSTLRSRIALVVSAVFLVFAGASALLLDRYFSDQFKLTVVDDQTALLAAQSAAITSKLRVAFDVLERTADQLPPGVLDDIDRAQAFLDRRSELRSIFTNGLFLISLDGHILAESQPVPGRRGRLMSMAAKLPSPAEAKGAYIMEPFPSSVRGRNQPNLSIGVWVRGANGEPVARLHGGTFLLGENWFADIRSLRFAKTGFVSVISRSGMVVAHRDGSRILGPLAPRGANAFLDRALDGFEGSDETMTSYGVAALSTAKSIPGTDWFLMATYPLAEAYAPLQRIRRYLAAIWIGGASVILLLTWAICFRTLGPLSRLSRDISAMTVEGREPTDVAVGGSEEVRQLGRAFNGLITTLAARQASERASQSKFFAAFRNSADYMAITRLSDGVFLEANDAAERVVEWRPEELVGRSALTLGIWVDRAEREAVARGVSTDGSVSDFPVRLRTKSGLVRDCRITASRLDLDGETCIVSAIRDVTEALLAARRIAELSVERAASLQRLRAITDNLPVSIVYADRERRIQFINRTGAAWFALPIDDILGRTVPELLARGSSASIADAVDHVLKGHPVQFEQTVAYPDGKTRTVDITYIPDADPTGRVRGYYALITDLTERKDADEQLRQAQRMEAIGQLTGGVAHDFNNLLAVIAGNLEMLAEVMDARDDRRVMLETARRATGRGAALARSLLAFARKQPLAPAAVDLNGLVRDMIDLLRRTVPASIELDFIAGAGIWSCEVDPGQLQNALLNLVANARDAMPDGGRLGIETGNARLDDEYAASHGDVTPGQYVMLVVSDTGVGMAPDVAARVFEPFFTTKAVGEGTGLGLSMVYGFVKQSKGHVKIYSEIGQGTTVRIYLPRVVAGSLPRPDAPTSANLQARGETVLVVEDDPDLRAVALRMLKSVGYEVLLAAEAHQAATLLRDTPRIALLLTDVVLTGGKSGPQLAKEAQAQFPGLKVLYMSGYTESAIVDQGRLGRGAHLVQKPFTKQELTQKVRAVLDAADSA